MKPIGATPRAIALSLFLALGLPDPAFALRVQAGLESTSGPDLKAALLEGPSAGLEELPEEFLAYERTLTDQINREGLFRIELQEDGFVSWLELADGEVLYDSQQVVIDSPDPPQRVTRGQMTPLLLLAYTPDSGLLVLNITFPQLRYISADGSKTHIQTKRPKFATELEPAFKTLISALVKSGGATRIRFPRQERIRFGLRPSEPAILEREVKIDLANGRGIARVVVTPRDRWIASILPAAGLEEMRTTNQGKMDVLTFAQQATATSVRVVIGPSTFEQVPGLRQAVGAFGRAGLEERFILLPEEGLPEAELTERLIDLAAEAFAVPNLSLVAYAGLEDRSMQRFEGMARMAGVSFQWHQPTTLQPLVRQILVDLGVPKANATEEAVGRFLEFAGLEEDA